MALAKQAFWLDEAINKRIRLSAIGPATLDFCRRHYYAFDEWNVVEGSMLTHNIRLRDERFHMEDILLANDWEPGCAEPAIADLLGALIVASGAKDVLETGGFTGFTAKRLARALNRSRGGTLAVCEIDPQRAARVQAELDVLRLVGVSHTVIADDVLRYIASLPNESLDFVWVDDDHDKVHVAAELAALLPKMRERGLICGHDVYGSCDLRTVFADIGGYSLDLPRLGPAGGLGIVQVA